MAILVPEAALRRQMGIREGLAIAIILELVEVWILLIDRKPLRNPQDTIEEVLVAMSLELLDVRTREVVL